MKYVTFAGCYFLNQVMIISLLSVPAFVFICSLKRAFTVVVFCDIILKWKSQLNLTFDSVLGLKFTFYDIMLSCNTNIYMIQEIN